MANHDDDHDDHDDHGDRAREDDVPPGLRQRLARLRELPPPTPPGRLETTLLSHLHARRASARAPAPRHRTARTGALVLGALAAAAAVALVAGGRLERRTTTGGQGPGGEGHAWPQPSAAPAPGRPPAVARAGQFRPLTFDDSPIDRGHVARVELSASSAAYLGWPVSAELPRARIQAEVLYGEDGTARGVRLLPASFHSASPASESPTVTGVKQ